MSGASESIRIHAPREQVFDVIADFARYPEFLPEIRTVHIESTQDNVVDVRFTAQILASVEYTLRLTLKRPGQILWELVQGQIMRKNEGSWVLKAQRDGSTQATYTIDVAFGGLVPSLVTSSLVHSTLPATLRRFKARVEQMEKSREPVKKTAK